MLALYRWLKRRRWPKEIRHLPEPESLSLAHWMGASWTERGIRELRTWRLRLVTMQEDQFPQTPTPDSSRATEREMDNTPKTQSSR
ncbi:hypothetical protein LCGC14_1912210 [marine sediment metagenome]|uniref:Uncharacterized protein n=1 Tax=marine sediment metagenome TaxID=412755 RepID=A0A0F9FTU0_9ZZZZ